MTVCSTSFNRFWLAVYRSPCIVPRLKVFSEGQAVLKPKPLASSDSAELRKG